MHMHMLWLALASHAFLSASPSIRARVAPPSIAATAEAEPVRMRVTVPAGVAAGDPLHVSTPAGELLIVTVPAGLQTGDPFDILVPALPPPPPPPLSAAQAGGGDLPHAPDSGSRTTSSSWSVSTGVPGASQALPT